MKIRLGNIEDAFKHPNIQDTSPTLIRALYNRFTSTGQLNEILMVWDDQDNLIVVKDITKDLIAYRRWVNRPIGNLKTQEDARDYLNNLLFKILDEYGGTQC